MSKLNRPLLLFSPEYFMYMGKAVNTVVHEHHAIQIAISIENAIEVILPGSVQQVKAILIDSDVPHECRTYGYTFLLINVDPACKIGAGLKTVCLANKKTAALPDALVERFMEELNPWLSESPDRDAIAKVTLWFLHGLSQTAPGEIKDDRIIKILEVLRQQGSATLKLKTSQHWYFSHQAGLSICSSSRLVSPSENICCG